MKVRWVLMLAAAVALAGAALSADSKSAVLGSPHDLRIAGNTGDACIACHTPHGANAAAKALLWHRAHRTAYAVYDTSINAEFAGGTVDLALGNKVSLLCLSCHDGAVATNMTDWGPNAGLRAIGGASGSQFAHPITELTRTHPVGFTYSNSVTGKPGEYSATPSNGVKLFVGTVQCASCHQPHDNSNFEFLRVANTNSALCLSCHQ